MFLNIVDISEKQLCTALEGRKNKLDYYHNAVWRLPHNENTNIMDLYYILIQAALFSDKGITLDELEINLKASYNTIRNRLAQIPQNFIISNSYKRTKYYMINITEIDKYLSEHK